ncbi:MAG: type III pantothenate kinase [Pirellulales bacterium]|nr:type III pantothenate kinase [Pirellulales bacterium]MBL7193838.1 type III pantothenate kinase [Pirellulales bacterium]MDA0817213.1 type III pantothenate kinase [Planctomycetota bacterium]
MSQPPGASLPAAGLAAVDTVLLADVGNSRIKLAVMTEPATGGTLPLLARRMDLASRSFHPANLDEWLRAVAPGPAVVLVASVHDVAATRLEAMIAELAATQHRTLRQRRIRPDDLPLQIDLPQPEKVGIDRLAAAAAANRLRSPGRPAVVVDCGTAVTVDLLSEKGVYLGGAILPGAPLMAKALADGTSKLPQIAALERGMPPAMPGTATAEAIAVGIGWGFRGAVSRLVAEGRRALKGDAEVVLTGGWRSAVREEFFGVKEMPDLVLEGVGLAVEKAVAR